MLTAILLSAGASVRFGSTKALVDIVGETAIARLQSVLVRSVVDQVIVVLGSDKERIEPYLLKHRKVAVVYNKDHKMGQTSSFQVGLQAADSQSAGYFLLPVDYPWVRLETIDELAGKSFQDPASILVPTFRGQKGHPPLFPARLRDTIFRLNPDQGVNHLVQQHAKQITFVPVDDAGVVTTFNSVAEFQEAQERIQTMSI